MSAKNDELLKQIQEAFPARPINGGHAFVEWGKSYPDAPPYRQQVDGKTWDQLDRAYIVRRSDALGFLSTRELVDVLPVYLRSVLEEGVWSPATGVLNLVLAKPRPPEKDDGLGVDRFNALIDMLTIAQREVTARVLKAFGDTDAEGPLGQAALAAFDDFWKQFLSTPR